MIKVQRNHEMRLSIFMKISLPCSLLLLLLHLLIVVLFGGHEKKKKHFNSRPFPSHLNLLGYCCPHQLQHHSSAVLTTLVP